MKNIIRVWPTIIEKKPLFLLYSSVQWQLLCIMWIHKVKILFPLKAWSGPEGSRNSRFPDFVTTAHGSGKVVSLRHRPHLPPGNSPGIHFCYRLSRSQGHSAIGRVMSMKNSNDTIWNFFFYIKLVLYCSFKVYIIVPLYTCFVLCLVRVSNEWGFGWFPRFCYLIPLCCSACCLFDGADFFYFILLLFLVDRLCGLVVRVSGYRYRGLGFDSRRYQIFWVVVGLKRGPLSLVRSIEELLE